mmetsp:Transcript_10804/g.30411  ORF Transcript_10804/g.30411 Transcript_10804/m.30411 type:complete len:321 (-) Transcript_10804:535-1497(-)
MLVSELPDPVAEVVTLVNREVCALHAIRLACFLHVDRHADDLGLLAEPLPLLPKLLLQILQPPLLLLLLQEQGCDLEEIRVLALEALDLVLQESKSRLQQLFLPQPQRDGEPLLGAQVVGLQLSLVFLRARDVLPKQATDGPFQGLQHQHLVGLGDPHRSIEASFDQVKLRLVAQAHPHCAQKLFRDVLGLDDEVPRPAADAQHVHLLDQHLIDGVEAPRGGGAVKKEVPSVVHNFPDGSFARQVQGHRDVQLVRRFLQVLRGHLQRNVLLQVRGAVKLRLRVLGFEDLRPRSWLDHQGRLLVRLRFPGEHQLLCSRDRL